MKEKATEARFDFRGGLNLSASQDSVDVHELLDCTNARVLASGAVQRRAGTGKTHVSVLGAGGRVQGIFDVGAHTIAIANGKLYWSTNLTGWTEVTPASGTFSTVTPADFTLYVGASGTALVFIASLGNVFTYNPSSHALTRIDGTNSVPSANSVRVYGDRVFYANGRTLTWSKIGDGTDCRTGGLSDGGFAVVGQDFRDDILALETVGSSLLLASASGISRFTGTSDDIRIDTDTFGVTADIGPVGSSHSSAFKRVGDVAFMWTTRGPYLVTEGGVTSLAEKLQTHGEAASAVQWRLVATDNAVVADNSTRNEAWFLYKSMDTTQLVTALVYNYAVSAWSGPFIFPVEHFSMSTVRIAGTDVFIAGGSDGFVRYYDDNTVSRDDGATDYTHRVKFAPLALNAGPFVTKSLRHLFVQVVRESANTVPLVKVATDGAAQVSATLVSTDGAVLTATDLRYDVDTQGKRFVVEWSGAYADGVDGDLPQLLGIVGVGSVMERL